jgi:hypothetical protein
MENATVPHGSLIAAVDCPPAEHGGLSITFTLLHPLHTTIQHQPIQAPHVSVDTIPHQLPKSMDGTIPSRQQSGC